MYKNKDKYISLSPIETFLNDPAFEYATLSPEQRECLEGDITLNELSAALDKANLASAPGSTGLSFSFYKHFWPYLGVPVLNSANYSFKVMSLPIQQRLGVISVIPKGDKPREFLKNWRPITLLNSTYKLISSSIAARINKFLPDIIGSDQNGFVRGRSMGECLRLTYDVLSWAKHNNKSGLLLSIDFEKAFDSVSFSFISKTLKFFNFGPDIVKWVELLLNNFKASQCGI